MRRYVLIPLYLMWAFIGIAVIYLLLLEPVTPWTVSYGVAFMAHVVVSVMVLREIALHELDGRRLSWWIMPALALTTAVASLLGLFLALYGEGNLNFPFGQAILPLVLTAWALAPRLPWQAIVITSTGMGLLMVGFGRLLDMEVADEFVSAFRVLWLPTFIFLIIMMLTIRWSIIVTVSVKDQAQMDAMRADLAVAEERLRIARDMHDILGRTLTAVALKSDLAAGLAAAGKTENAVMESKAVHQLADEALRELRGVLAGYRRPDLVTELAGAKGLLDSAGVATRIIGEGRDLPSMAAEAFSWVLREAATNIVRHSDASWCTIRLGYHSNAVQLSVSNNGVRTRASKPRWASTGKGSGGPKVSQDSPFPGGDALPSIEGGGSREPSGAVGYGAERSSGVKDERATDERLTDEVSVPGSGLAGLRVRLESIGGTLGVEENGDTFVLTARVPLSRGDEEE
ncbi:histidine kinase [Actinomycetaceae bacterium L2_0104]